MAGTVQGSIRRIKVCANAGRRRDEHPGVPVSCTRPGSGWKPGCGSVADAGWLTAAGSAVRWLRILVEIKHAPGRSPVTGGRG